ncbi:MAG: betI 1 [Conexibacter sp.]|nr:betI 1 [Conexibacter sp.]
MLEDAPTKGPGPDEKPRRVITRGLPEVRHEELIRATLRCLVTRGPVGTTVRAIASEADLSPSLITYHFGGKKELLSGAYTYLSRQMREAEAQALHAAGEDPYERLMAFLRVGFEPRFLNEEYITARFLFWGLARTDADVGRVHDEIYSSFRTMLSDLLVAAVGRGPDHDRLVFALSALLDGLWLEWCLNHESVDPEAMMHACRQMISGSLADGAGSAPSRAARPKI